MRPFSENDLEAGVLLVLLAPNLPLMLLAMTIGNERAPTDARTNPDTPRVRLNGPSTNFSSFNQSVSEIGNVGSGNCPCPRLYPYLKPPASE